MESPNQPKRTTDERIDAIAMNLELASRMQQASDERITKLAERIDKLTATVEKHEQDWERVRRSVRAALTEWFSDNGDQGEEEQ